MPAIGVCFVSKAAMYRENDNIQESWMKLFMSF
jgi:hypothetical protein